MVTRFTPATRSLLAGCAALLTLLAGAFLICRPYPARLPAAAPLPASAPAPVICLDPGHPSEVHSGQTLQQGARETEVNWRITRLLATQLRASGLTVVLTKHASDEYVTNRARAEIANAAGAALFLRLHCDTGTGSGYALYYPRRQGRLSGMTGPSFAVIAGSRRAAEALHRGMTAVLGSTLPDNGIHGDEATQVGSRQGALTGSIYSRVPVVTVEMVYLSHPADAGFITSEAGAVLMASALCTGILDYLDDTRQWPLRVETSHVSYTNHGNLSDSMPLPGRSWPRQG